MSSQGTFWRQSVAGEGHDEFARNVLGAKCRQRGTRLSAAGVMGEDGKGGIKGLAASGKELFSHEYVFDSYNADYDFYFFKSKDGNQDEFSCFAMRSDTPASTHHIEFRYGTDIESLSEFCTGKYAYWMAAGVLENSDKEQQESIRLFVKENTAGN